MKWRVINSGFGPAAWNMAVDEAILHAHAGDAVPPTVRFYGWQPAAMSIGYFQKAAAEVNLEQCRQAGIAVVRRLTGGRAVLHAAELTYSVVVRADAPRIPATITASYHYFSAGLLAGLQALGIEAGLSMPRAAYSQAGPRRRPASAACFDAPSQYELTVSGRKLAGSAQVRKDGVILQHGSILLAFQPEQVAALLKLPSPEQQSSVAALLASRAISVQEILGREVSWDSVRQTMTIAFATALGLTLEPGRLSAQEQAAAEELVRTKYGCDSWNLLR